VRPMVASLRRRVFRRPGRPTPQTDAWLSLDRLHEDGWAGPTVVVGLVVETRDARVVLRGSGPSMPPPIPLEIEAFLDGRSLGSRPVGGARADIDLMWRLEGAALGAHELRIVANTFVVPNDQFGNHDFRPLSYRVSKLDVEGGRLA
jgi:hypothetical protein